MPILMRASLESLRTQPASAAHKIITLHHLQHWLDSAIPERLNLWLYCWLYDPVYCNRISRTDNPSSLVPRVHFTHSFQADHFVALRTHHPTRNLSCERR